MLKVSKSPWVAVEGSKKAFPRGARTHGPSGKQKNDEFASKALPRSYNDFLLEDDKIKAKINKFAYLH